MRIEIFRTRGLNGWKRWPGGFRLGALGAGLIVCRGDEPEGFLPPEERQHVILAKYDAEAADRRALAARLIPGRAQPPADVPEPATLGTTWPPTPELAERTEVPVLDPHKDEPTVLYANDGGPPL